MQVKIFLTKREFTKVGQQAQLINGDIDEDTIMSLTIDDHRIAVDVPNMSRSLQREIVVDRQTQSVSDPNVYDMDVPGKD
jgi:hypothetical protein